LKSSPVISVFEQSCLWVGPEKENISSDQYDALVRYYGKGSPFFTLLRNGVRFNQYVGVIQIGNTLIEVLPKISERASNEDRWRKILVGMLRAVSGFDLHSTSSAKLKIKPNTILELYFELFLKEVRYLLNSGLLKTYRKTECNNLALKGSIVFSKNIQFNHTHQERFYTRYTIYDQESELNKILYKTLMVLERINTSPALTGEIGALLLAFPEMLEFKVNQKTFEKIAFNRKNLGYKKAIEIAKMILLQYHPDLRGGRNHVLALMFDMNVLWQEFVYASLRKNEGMKVTGQGKAFFWMPEGGNRRTVKPDLVIDFDNRKYALDTKWKIVDMNPSIEDLRQMYAYHHYCSAEKTALFYPCLL
jgi:5-methylcytosine-specific restriction enzyme subunit McrC